MLGYVNYDKLVNSKLIKMCRIRGATEKLTVADMVFGKFWQLKIDVCQ